MSRRRSRTPTATLRAAALLPLVFLAGCASTGTRPAYAPEPAVCTDSVYVQLRTQDPDSLSDRAWQRFQQLDRECAAARLEAARAGDAGTGMHRSMGWWMASGLVMAVMMVAMFSSW